MSVVFSELLSDYLKCQSIKSSSSLLFSSGCVYEGTVKDNQACGYGKFNWSNNDFYEGFYSNGVRVKVGIQKWCDGDEYSGEFYMDKRHGWGIYKWWNGDSYEGSFYEDTRHGFGIYRSQDGNVYEGTFYRNKREGFGIFRYLNGDIFQGLYKENYRCGPGILIYQDGSHDIGLWHRGSILKLIVNIEEVFQISQFSDLLAQYPNDNVESLSNPETSDTDNAEYPLDDILKYKMTKPKNIEIFEKDINVVSNVDIEDSITDEASLHNGSQVTISNEIENQDEPGSDLTIILESPPNEPQITIELIDSQEIIDPHKVESRHETIKMDDSFPEFLKRLTIARTCTPLMFKVLDHLRRFSKNVPMKRNDEIQTDINTVVQDVVINIFDTSSITTKIDRHKKYAFLGEIETKSNLLITSSHNGNLNEIKRLFSNSSPPNANVTDCRGSFSLLETVLNWNIDLVNYLLDCGADVNQITDEGISALGSCYLFYYPEKGFIETIAESVVALSYTPTNFNGVRREPVTNPNKQNDLIDTSKPDNEIKKTDNTEELQESSTEQWNDYQKPLFPSNDILNTNKWTNENSNDFESHRNTIEYPTKVGPKLIEKAASVLSNNSLMMQRQPRPNSRHQELSTNEGTTRFKALQIARHNQMLQVILLLLRRGANPNVCKIPFPGLFFAVKSGDVEMTKVLISKGANVNARLSPQNGSLTPLHIASCLPGKRGIVITELLLKNGADPNARASDDESFLDKSMIGEWSKDLITDEQAALIGGRTPLHLACSRYDDFKVSYQIVQMLLEYGGDPNIICNGHSSLTLAIASGNDLIVDKLLANEKINVNLQLTHGLGNALCVASSTVFEHTRTIESRVALIKKLILAGADLLNLVPIGQKRALGSAVDYAYNVFYLDQRVSRLPYHALTSVERDLFNNRKNMLSYMGMFTRECAVEKEKLRLDSLKIEGIESRGLSPEFIWTGAGADVETQMPITNALSKVSRSLTNLDFQMQGSDLLARKPLFKYCYECGRSINVKLTACTRCKEVSFCSKLCKTKAWNTRHKFECLRVGGRVSTAGGDSKNNRNTDSPTPATILEDPTLSKDGFEQTKADSTRQKKKIQKTDYDEMDSESRINRAPRKLPPLESRNHPSYSYTYITGEYIKFDDCGKMIVLDNYSFV